MQDDEELGPVDDFDDDLDFADDFDDGEFDDDLAADSSVGGGDDWDEFEENNDPLDGLGDMPKAAKKKPKININLVVIGGVLLVGAGILASQFMSKKSTVPQPPAQEETQQVAQPAPVEQPKPVKSLVISQNGTIDGVFQLPEEVEEFDAEGSDNAGFLYDPDILEEAQTSLDDSPPMPSAMVSEGVSVDEDIDELDEFTEMLELDPEPKAQPVKKQTPAIVMPVVDAKEAVVDEIDDFDLPMKEVTLEPDPLPSATTMAEKATQKEMMNKSVVNGSLEEKLDSILSRLDKMEQQMSKVEGGSDANIDERLMKLQKKIDSMSTSGAVSSVKKASVSTKKSTPRKKSRPKKRVAKVSWELKSAQPGRAWVSKKGQSSVQEVSVGDNLSGVGRVTSIAPMQGRWVVQGTSGSIKQ